MYPASPRAHSERHVLAAASTHRHAACDRPDAIGPSSANGGPSRPRHGPPLEELGFDKAYRRVHLPAHELQNHDRRLEFWDGATSTAFEVREPVSPYHERPSQRLATLAERIASVRGHPIQCFGTMDLVLPGPDGRPARLMQADQSLYLQPHRANLVGPSAMVVGENHYPDVVLEVDLSTDVRRHKLGLYAAWGFPELWVDVPDEARRPRKPRGATIYVLANGAFQEVAESRAFPGWRSEDIHLALNEERLSAHTAAILERLGALLGERDGTGPDDDPMLRSQRQQARSEGRDAGRQEAFASELERRAAMVRFLMISRHLEVAADFPLGQPGFAEADPERLMSAAMNCENETEFIMRLADDG